MVAEEAVGVKEEVSENLGDRPPTEGLKRITPETPTKTALEAKIQGWMGELETEKELEGAAASQESLVVEEEGGGPQGWGPREWCL